MGVDLGRPDEGLSMNHATWANVLMLALLYGWEPMGTDDPITGAPEGGWGPEGWDRWDYSSNDWQVVEDEDAANIADALERALGDIPDQHAEPWEVTVRPRVRKAEHDSYFVTPADLLSCFSGNAGRRWLQSCMGFLRKGHLVIS